MIEFAILVGIVGALVLGWCLVNAGNDSVTRDAKVLPPAVKVTLSPATLKTLVGGKYNDTI